MSLRWWWRSDAISGISAVPRSSRQNENASKSASTSTTAGSVGRRRGDSASTSYPYDEVGCFKERTLSASLLNLSVVSREGRRKLSDVMTVSGTFSETYRRGFIMMLASDLKRKSA